ncbi:hypothetical protein, partial [Teichococcus aestuarii]|uniref:hypothetical protein n=1 Tax=Teichococcus aestuarii TaxID=568898 RepID=UPI00360AB580
MSAVLALRALMLGGGLLLGVKGLGMAGVWGGAAGSLGGSPAQAAAPANAMPGRVMPASVAAAGPPPQRLPVRAAQAAAPMA